MAVLRVIDGDVQVQAKDIHDTHGCQKRSRTGLNCQPPDAIISLETNV